jgi:ADP-ribosyl-[dinitrogen reductase] hydrolase
VVDACRYLGALLLGAFGGASKEDLLSPSYCVVPGYWERHPLAPEIRGMGYAADSLEAALWAFHTTDSFEEGCLRAVNLRGDADTTMAVYGQIAVAYYVRAGFLRGGGNG